MRIQHLVEKSFQTTHPHTGIDSVEKRLRDNSFLVVSDGDSFLGILTPSDIIESPHQLVIDCVHHKARVRPEQDIESVLTLMNESRNSVLPVFKGDEFIGVVTQTAITDYLLEYRDELRLVISEHTAELAEANKQLRREIEKNRQTAEALKSAHDEVEQRVKERTAELAKANEQLKHEMEGRNQTEEMLRGNEALLREVIDLVPHAIYAYDRAGLHVLANRKAAEMVGTTVKGLIGTRFADVFHEKEQLSRFLADTREVIASGQARYIREEPFTDAEGNLRVIQTSKIPFTWPATAEQVVLGVSVDITDLKRAEERLHRIKDCFLSFGSDSLENINLLTGLCGELLGGTCALYNRLEGELLCSVGQWNTPPDYNPKDRPEGHICFDVIQKGEDAVMVVRDLPNTHYAKTDPNVVPYGLQTYIGRCVKCGDEPVGSLCIVFQRDIVLSEDDERVLEIAASAISIEENRRRAEEEMRDSRRRYRALFESAAEGLLVADIKTKEFKHANPSICGMLGYSEEELKQMSVYDLHPREALEHVISEFEAQAAGKALAPNIPCLRKDGTTIYADIHTTATVIDGVECNVGFFIDVTERKHMEKELREREAALEIRTANLEEANTALKVVLKRRDEDRVRLEEKVLSNVNQLIAPYIEKLKEGEMDSTQKAYLNILESNLEEIVSPFSRTLSYSSLNLTPTELRVSNLIKHGKSTKQIARLLNVSDRTIDSHRDSIRRKLGIKQKRTNLRSCLLSIQ